MVNPLKRDDRKKILGEVPSFEEAPEPNNIMWENLWMTDYHFIKRLIFALSFIVVLIVLSFWVLMTLNRKAIELNTKYPIIDCKSIYEIYSPERIQQQTGLEYYQQHYAESHPQFTPPPTVGILPCFCHK